MKQQLESEVIRLARELVKLDGEHEAHVVKIIRKQVPPEKQQEWERVNHDFITRRNETVQKLRETLHGLDLALATEPSAADLDEICRAPGEHSVGLRIVEAEPSASARDIDNEALLKVQDELPTLRHKLGDGLLRRGAK